MAVHQAGQVEPVELWRLIAAMDWINHALPLDDEIKLGVGALVRFGLVSVADGPHLALTLEGRELVASCESRSVRAMGARIASALPDTLGRDEAIWSINEHALTDANRRYADEVRRNR